MARRRSRGGGRAAIPQRTSAALCATCLVDQFFPEVGEASVRILRRLGVDLRFPEGQTCCGQVGFNGGFHDEAREVAARFIDVFDGDDYVVIPSGSCATMVKVFYPELFQDDTAMRERAGRLSERTHELTDFIVNVLGVTDVGAGYQGAVTYHDSCHTLRELRQREEGRALLDASPGVDLTEMQDADRCCGFGGLFSIKYPHISNAILEEKLASVEATGAGVVTATDCGCLMHLRGAITRKGMRQRTLHIAEVLAGDAREGG